jgi:hypothetical protein
LTRSNGTQAVSPRQDGVVASRRRDGPQKSKRASTRAQSPAAPLWVSGASPSQPVCRYAATGFRPNPYQIKEILGLGPRLIRHGLCSKSREGLYGGSVARLDVGNSLCLFARSFCPRVPTGG